MTLFYYCFRGSYFHLIIRLLFKVSQITKGTIRKWKILRKMLILTLSWIQLLRDKTLWNWNYLVQIRKDEGCCEGYVLKSILLSQDFTVQESTDTSVYPPIFTDTPVVGTGAYLKILRGTPWGAPNGSTSRSVPPFVYTVTEVEGDGRVHRSQEVVRLSEIPWLGPGRTPERRSFYIFL